MRLGKWMGRRDSAAHLATRYGIDWQKGYVDGYHQGLAIAANEAPTRDALASALSAVYVDHPMWTHKGAVWTCRCGASLGRFNDPVTSKPIEPLPLWHAHVAEVQADALASAAALTEDPS